MGLEIKRICYILCPTLVLCSGLALKDLVKDAKDYKSTNDIKNEIKQKYPSSYDSIMNKPYATKPVSFNDWQYELKLLDEKQKTDSLVQKAYFEGEQKVRDSIKNVKKAD